MSWIPINILQTHITDQEFTPNGYFPIQRTRTLDPLPSFACNVLIGRSSALCKALHKADELPAKPPSKLGAIQFGDVALAMLKMMGHSATVPGAILAEDVPTALSPMTAAIDAEKAAPPIEDKDADEPAVSMAHRALPPIALFAAAAKAESNVMWK